MGGIRLVEAQGLLLTPQGRLGWVRGRLARLCQSQPMWLDAATLWRLLRCPVHYGWGEPWHTVCTFNLCSLMTCLHACLPSPHTQLSSPLQEWQRAGQQADSLAHAWPRAFALFSPSREFPSPGSSWLQPYCPQIAFLSAGLTMGCSALSLLSTSALCLSLALLPFHNACTTPKFHLIGLVWRPPSA